MNLHRAFNWLLALAIAATMGIVNEQPEPAALVARTPEQIAQDHCGPGAALIWLDDGKLACRMHNGKGKTTVVAGVTQ